MLLKEKLESIIDRLVAIDLDVREFKFSEPATEDEVRHLEEELVQPLPTGFRDVLLKISRHVEFSWFIPDGFEFPPPFDQIFCGDLHWSIDITRTVNAGWEEGVAATFPNRSDPYDSVWYDKLPFYEVGNGDLLAIDLADDRHEQIVYLSHDGSDLNGYALANDFHDLLSRWVPLACPGGEDWQWLPFTNDSRSQIDPESENGKLWRKIVGL